MKHELKIWPQYFCRVLNGSKTFEVRNNDRGFQPGDIVCLNEWDPTIITKTDCEGTLVESDYKGPRGYTGGYVQFRVGYVLPIDDDRVVFSLLPLEEPV